MPLTADHDIAELLQGARTIALVGASDNPGRASFGVMNDEAAAKAEAAGLKVVMDHCPKIEFARLGLQPVA